MVTQPKVRKSLILGLMGKNKSLICGKFSALNFIISTEHYERGLSIKTLNEIQSIGQVSYK